MSKSFKTEFAVWHEYDVLLGDNTIYMGSHYCEYDGDESGVDFLMAERTIKNLHILDKRVHEDGITIKMNNIGGDIYHGLAIYDAIITCQNKIRIIAYGHAMSMGSLIFQAADERVLSPNGRMMLHYGHSSVSGHMQDIYKHTDELKKLDKLCNEIYLKRIKEEKPRFTMRQLEDKIKFDWFLSPKEALEFGLCDKVLE